MIPAQLTSPSMPPRLWATERPIPPAAPVMTTRRPWSRPREVSIRESLAALDTVITCSFRSSPASADLSALDPWGGSPHHEGIGGGVIVGRDHDALGLEVFVDGLDPVLPSETGLLHASERNHVAVGAVGVDPDCADLQRFRDPQGPADVAGPDARDEAVSDIVTQQAGLVLVGELDDGQDRAEDLLLRNAHVVAYLLVLGRG